MNIFENTYTIKICSKFNTIEFEAKELPSTEELQKVYDVLSAVVVKDEDKPQRAVSKEKTTQKNDKPASESQLKAMGWMGIKIPNNCSMSQARALMMKWNAEHTNQ